MKKILFILLSLLALSGGAWGQDQQGTPQLKISTVEVKQGGDGVIELEVVLNGVDARDLQIDFTVPEGFSFPTYMIGKDEYGKDEPGPAASPAHTTASSFPIADNTHLRRVVLSSQQGTHLSDGIILKVTIHNDTPFALNTIKQGSVSGAILSKDLEGGVGDNHIADFTFDIKIIENSIHLYDTEETLNQLTANLQYEGHLRLHRELKANQWNTIILPFDLSYEQAQGAFGDDVRLATFNGAVWDGNLSYTVLFNSVNPPTSNEEVFLQANTPYIIRTSKKGTISFDDGILFENIAIGNSMPNEMYTEIEEVDPQTGEDRAHYFIGTYNKKSITSQFNAYLSNNKFYFLRKNESATVKGFRGYFELYNLQRYTGKVTSSNIAFFVDDEQVDGIDGVMTSNPVVKGVYDLQGRKVSDDLNTLKSGVYIVNGKKMMVK